MRKPIHFFSAVATILACGAQAAYADYPDPLRCLIEASDTVELSSPVEGIIAAIEVERGDYVKAGQTIARLDTLIETISLKLARLRANNTAAIRAREARLEFLVLQAERSTKLAERKTISEAKRDEALQEAEVARQELQAARLDLEIAKLEAKKAAALLEQKVLRTPINGVVVERLLSAGEYQAGDTKIATIAKVDVLHVEAIAPIDYYNRLSVGDIVTIRPEQPIGGAYEARITVIDHVLDAATGTFGFRMELPNKDNVLPAGLRCTVEFSPPPAN
ncbi:MAG TPA: efflux RND transporter periplasmic adaptor subunit [Sedimenticola sp.]|nr:efflux RND transporter periplasmic adaptor subunit [Sedimenticola sp.]